MMGCRGCLGGLLVLAVLAGQIVLLALVLGWFGAPTGGLLLVAAALLVARASTRRRAGRRPAPAMLPSLIRPASGQHRVAVVRACPSPAARAALARGGDGSQESQLGESRSDVPASRHSERDRASDDPPAAYPGMPTGDGVRRARDPMPARLRFAVLQRDGFRCRYCGRSGSAPGVVLHVDHVVPIAAGGATTEGNLLTACEECNLGKATRAVVA